jgi:hypothetical protein
MPEIPCPICKKIMKTVDSPGVLMCGTKKKIFVPELDAEIDTMHAMYYVNPDGAIPLRVIEVPPYAFEIHDSETLKRTRIIKVVDPNAKIVNKKKSNRTFKRETLIVVPGALNCQWDDAQLVFDKIKMLMLFS